VGVFDPFAFAIFDDGRWIEACSQSFTDAVRFQISISTFNPRRSIMPLRAQNTKISPQKASPKLTGAPLEILVLIQCHLEPSEVISLRKVLCPRDDTSSVLNFQYRHAKHWLLPHMKYQLGVMLFAVCATTIAFPPRFFQFQTCLKRNSNTQHWSPFALLLYSSQKAVFDHLQLEYTKQAISRARMQKNGSHDASLCPGGNNNRMID
jgi:hypothetical protein